MLVVPELFDLPFRVIAPILFLTLIVTPLTFSPDMSVTRGMMAQMIYAMEGRPATAPNASYRDVPSTMYYASAAAFVSANGIMTGYDGNTFGPEDQLTRE